MSATGLLTELVLAERWLNRLAQSGPDLRATAHLKLAAEAREFAENPTLEEAADVLICLTGASAARGWTLGDLAAAVAAKVIVNEARTWEQQADGTWQHVAGGEQA